MSKINKENFNEHTLRRLQLTQVEILDEIVRICDSNNLRYCLIGGTLLGAIRHKGFIPWDDDLDIAMPRKDYDEFNRICIGGGLNEKYYVHNIISDENYWLIFAKIRKKNTLYDEENISHLNVNKEIFVDVFPLDETKSENNKWRTKIIKHLSNQIYIKRGLKIQQYKKSKILARLLMPYSIKQLTNWQIKLMTKENKKLGKYYINYGSNYNTVSQTILKTKYEPFKKAEFEGKLYNIPNDADYVLRRVYNDYMQLPSEDKRTLRHKPLFINFGDDISETI